MFLTGNSLFERKTREISTYSCTFSTLQAPGLGQGKVGAMPSTNIEERNRAKTQSAVVFISLTQASVNEKFWYIYINYNYIIIIYINYNYIIINRRRSKMCAAV